MNLTFPQRPVTEEALFSATPAEVCSTRVACVTGSTRAILDRFRPAGRTRPVCSTLGRSHRQKQVVVHNWLEWHERSSRGSTKPLWFSSFPSCSPRVLSYECPPGGGEQSAETCGHLSSSGHLGDWILRDQRVHVHNQFMQQRERNLNRRRGSGETDFDEEEDDDDDNNDDTSAPSQGESAHQR